MDNKYSLLYISLKINESLMVALKKLYNWYYKYRKIAEEGPASKVLVENKDYNLAGSKLFGEPYIVMTLSKPKLKDILVDEYDV